MIDGAEAAREAPVEIPLQHISTMNMMVPPFQPLGLFAVIVGADILMRLVVTLSYSDNDRILRILKFSPRIPNRSERLHKSCDAWLAPLPFLWTWCDIVAATLLAGMLHHPLGWCALIIWVGGRFRALQEFGHNAVHGALCGDKNWQWRLSDFFFQFPSFKQDMPDRQIKHTSQHHHHPNDEREDPNLARVIKGKMVPNMTPTHFYLRLLNPFSPTVLMNNVGDMWKNMSNSMFKKPPKKSSNKSKADSYRSTRRYRILSLCLFALVMYAVGGWKAIAFGWLIPLVTTYQLFAWIAILAEHRWHVQGRAESPRAYEYIAGRPTDYPGFSGWMVRMLISPTSDAYHLAHSLYPAVRWNYLPAIDRALKVTDPLYTRHASRGLLLAKDGIPSALSELRERLTGAK